MSSRMSTKLIDPVISSDVFSFLKDKFRAAKEDDDEQAKLQKLLVESKLFGTAAGEIRLRNNNNSRNYVFMFGHLPGHGVPKFNQKMAADSDSQRSCFQQMVEHLLRRLWLKDKESTTRSIRDEKLDNPKFTVHIKRISKEDGQPPKFTPMYEYIMLLYDLAKKCGCVGLPNSHIDPSGGKTMATLIAAEGLTSTLRPEPGCRPGMDIRCTMGMKINRMLVKEERVRARDCDKMQNGYGGLSRYYPEGKYQWVARNVLTFKGTMLLCDQCKSLGVDLPEQLRRDVRNSLFMDCVFDQETSYFTRGKGERPVLPFEDLGTPPQPVPCMVDQSREERDEEMNARVLRAHCEIEELLLKRREIIKTLLAELLREQDLYNSMDCLLDDDFVEDLGDEFFEYPADLTLAKKQRTL
jgi:hypothetical protein